MIYVICSNAHLPANGKGILALVVNHPDSLIKLLIKSVRELVLLLTIIKPVGFDINKIHIEHNPVCI